MALAMATTLPQLEQMMLDREDENLEFKEAKERYDFEKLKKYCCALANEGGGAVVLGVTDRRPRRVVGSRAFDPPERTVAGLVQALHLRVDADELAHPDGRVLIFYVPSRPIGMPIQLDGAYWMRAGEDLVPMTPDRLGRIFAEAQPDYSSEICEATFADLDRGAVERFRAAWERKSGAPRATSAVQLLEDAELIIDGSVTLAALVLLGTTRALSRHLPQAEIVFEYRSNAASIEFQQRREFREGFFNYLDDLWETVNLRNELYSYQAGLFRREIPRFNEMATREAILNAVSHRDYRLAGSTWVRQCPEKIEIVSPGGFPTDVTPENILFRQNPRNRRIAEALARCGLVERSGQGADRMFETSLREGKLPPDFSDSDAYQVSVTLHGEVTEPLFLTFLEDLHQSRGTVMQTVDLIVLDAVRRSLPVPERVKERIPALVDLGAIERVGRKKLVLAKRFYGLAGMKGEYTRKRGLDRDTKKALLLKHITDNSASGTPFEELAQVLPSHTRNEIKVLLRELRDSHQIQVVGTTRAARWYRRSQT
jgi:ATP-dependent DNA helicase RecG